VLEARPSGILTDLDGTLAPIAERPEGAEPLPQALEALTTLAERLAVVGIVTGRAVSDAREMLGGAAGRLLVIGNHGLEWLAPGDTDSTLDPSLVGISEEVAEALALVPLMDGVVVEPKGVSGTIHYRLAADPATARSSILQALGGRHGRRLEVREGRMSVELRPADAGDKGSAVRSVVERYGLRGLLVAGDDVTDLDMFAAVRDLAGRGVLRRTAVLAVGGGTEVPSSVADAADAVLAGPPALAGVLAELASRS
jgi:trehalose 6-phosphate phosphatase